MSAIVSMVHPIAQRTIPAISLDCPKEGLLPPMVGSETAGELSIVRGNETVQTYDVVLLRELDRL